MYIPFNEMPTHAKVWVYQANRELTQEEITLLETQSKDFLEQWAAHQQPLKSSSNIFYSRFLVIAVDESFNAASGCSIDASVHFVQSLESKLKVDFFDRSKVAFFNPEEKVVFTEDLKNLKQKIAEGIIQAETPVFNNLVTDLASFQREWQKPAQSSWLARYF